jgi:hypothetical protein
MSLAFWITLLLVACLAVWLFLRWFDRRNRVEVYTPRDSNQQMAKLKPYFRREVVETKIKSLFPNHDPAEILRLLGDDDVPSIMGRERMQLNILKLSNGDVGQLRHYIEVAKSERGFLKVIELAEHPESSHIGLGDKDLFWGEHKRLIESDFRQYLKWLKKK